MDLITIFPNWQLLPGVISQTTETKNVSMDQYKTEQPSMHSQMSVHSRIAHTGMPTNGLHPKSHCIHLELSQNNSRILVYSLREQAIPLSFEQ